VDATVEADLATMYAVWLGKVPLRTAMRDGRLTITGLSAIVRRMPAVMELSPIAEIVAAANR
jgi:hypothetical protein